jgi:glycosyltransferase involved in cell wall biosynthesis
VSARAAIVITTRNRRDELRRALTSAVAQEGDIEVVVFDDGSDDGTGEMVREQFPGVRVHREERSVGLIVARNRAAELVETPVIVSIDDDAEFGAPDTVEQALRDLDASRIGAVAIPHVDVNRDGPRAPTAPDRDHVWVTSVFVGTAHALRRDVFRSLGGYRGDFFHQGEEVDFCLRMLDAGWWVRLGRAAEPIRHHESARRDLERMDVYGRRNELLHAWLNLPATWVAPYMAGYALKGLVLGVRLRRPGPMVRGIARGLAASARSARRRRPVRAATLRVDRRLRRERAVRLEDVAPALHPPEERDAEGRSRPGRLESRAIAGH